MPEEDEIFSYAWITEFGIAAPEAVDAFTDLEDNARRLQDDHLNAGGSGREYDHRLVAMIGSTDIVEIAYFNQVYHLFEVAESNVRSSRRSLGARCLSGQELSRCTARCDQYEIVGLDDILKETKSGQPFIGFLYLRLSAAAKLCVPAAAFPRGNEGKPTLTDTFLYKFFSDAAPIWSLYQSICLLNLGDTEKSSLETRLQIAPLVGLDSVDVVLVLRFARLEQLAAAALAVRHQKLGSVWPAVRDAEPEAYVSSMLELLKFQQDTITSNWDASPLFKEVRTIWGLPLFPDDPGGAKWRFETGKNWEMLAAREAVPLTRTRTAPDRIEEIFKPLGLVGAVEECSVIEKENESSRSSLVLFGEFDSLSMPSETAALRSIKARDIREHFRHLTGIKSKNASGKDDSMKAGIWPSTEIAVRLFIPREIDIPSFDLMKLFLRRFRSQRKATRIAPKSGWTKIWLERAKYLGISYSTTNEVVNMLSSFMVFLEKDPERFADLLPVIRRLLEVVKSDRISSQREVVWLVSRINELFRALARQFWPLQSKGFTLGVERNVGYKSAGDAFIAFSKTMASGVLPGHQLIVLDHAGGNLTCEVGPFRLIVLRTSPFVLHYPLSWSVASEFGYSRLSCTTVRELPETTQESIQALCSRLGQSVDSRETIRSAYERFGDHLYRVSDSGLSKVFVGSLHAVFCRVLTDVFLWRSVCLRNEPAEFGLKRFWLINGPALVSSMRNHMGKQSSEITTIQQIVLRVFLVNHLLSIYYDDVKLGIESAALIGSRDLAEALVLLLRRSLSHDFHLEKYPATHAVDYRERAFVHLQCLRLDLRISRAKWESAIGLLKESLENILEESPQILDLFGQWLKSAQFLLDHWFLAEFQESLLTRLFCEYLTEIAVDWSTADPWPPFIEHHRVDTDVEDGRRINKSALRSRLRDDDPSGGFVSLRGGVFVRSGNGVLKGQREYHRKTGSLIRRLADCVRPIRLDLLSGELPFA